MLLELLDHAGEQVDGVLVSVVGGHRGHVLWLSAALFDEVFGIDPDPGFRFDDWIADRETPLALDDPALLHNANTPEEWRRLAGAGD